MSSIIKLIEVEKQFKTGNEKLSILKDLNLEIEEGSKVVIVGESGSGKSTLLNIIGGIDKVTTGTVIADKMVISKLNEKQIAEYRSKFLGFIFQFHYLLKDFTALENVYLPAMIAGLPKKQAMERAEKLLSDTGVFERKNHLPSELSGGERQRVAVARALINNPSLILADEPTGNLDPENAQKIGGMLFEMVEKYNKTLLLVTHDLNLAKQGKIIYRIKNANLELTSLENKALEETK